MSLLVDVSIKAANIVEAAWARAVANRERMRRRLDVQAERENAYVKGGNDTFWETVYTTPTPSLYQPDEPVAYPFNDNGILSIGRAWIRQPQNTAGLNFFTVWSGDGQAMASVETPLVNGLEFRDWSLTTAAPENLGGGLLRFAPNTVYNINVLTPNAFLYSETGGDLIWDGPNPPWEYARLFGPVTAADGVTYANETVVLPIGGESAIVVVTWDVITSAALVVYSLATPTVHRIVSSGSTVRSGEAAFFVNRTTVRPISLPASIANRPAPTLSSSGPYGTPSYAFAPWWKLNGPIDVGNAWRFTIGSDDSYGSIIQYSLYTPGQYLWINGSPAAQSLLGTTGNDPPVSEVRALLPSNVANFKETLFTESFDGGTLTYTMSNSALQRNNGEDYVEDAVYNLDDPGWSRAKVQIPPNVVRPAEAFGLEAARFWDWGKPSFCREQLLGLGFSAADLSP